MKNYDLLELAGRNLRESVLRNSLTTVGIAVGVASLVAMLSLGIGLQELASNRLGRSGLFDIVYVTSRTEFRDRNEERRGEQGKDAPLDALARANIEKLPNVIEVWPEVRFMTEVRFAETSHAAFVAALPISVRDTEAFEDMTGAYFSSADANEAILQQDFARELSPSDPKALVGKEVVLRYAERQAEGDQTAETSTFSVIRREQPLKVVGVIENEPFGGMRMSSRARLFIPVALADKLNIMQSSDVRGVLSSGARGRTYLALNVRVSGAGKVTELQNAINKMGLRTFSLLDATRNLRRFFAVLDLFLGIFGSLALAVASLGIINTLVMAILERRREIGIMKAIGASDADVKSLFFAEAGAMGLAGGVFGVTLGWAIGKLINFGTNVYLSRLELPPENIWSVPWWLVLAALGFAVVVSLLSGLYPAARASKLDPVQALRYE